MEYVAGCSLVEFLTMACDKKEIPLQMLEEQEIATNAADKRNVENEKSQEDSPATSRCKNSLRLPFNSSKEACISRQPKTHNMNASVAAFWLFLHVWMTS